MSLLQHTPMSTPLLAFDTPNIREIGWYLDGDLIGDTLYSPTDAELEAGAQLWLDGAA